MEDLKEECLKKLSFKPLMYKRYVDDIFAIIPENKADGILQVSNACDKRKLLRFTIDIQCNKRLSFLDTMVINDNDIVKVNWYRKPTDSGRYINHFSSHPINYKISVINNLVDRGIKLADSCFHESNLECIEITLLQNDYPLEFIKKHVNKRLHSIKRPKKKL